MKSGQLFIGLILGALLGFGLTKLMTSKNETTQSINTKINDNVNADSTKWKYSDSLDALKAAPDNHKIVYEDDNVRILQVVLDGLKEESIHTHKWKSIMWVTKPAVPCVFYNYDLDKDNKIAIKDSVTIPKMPINLGSLLEPEGPHGIRNLGKDNGIAYRVEFKKEFVK